MVEPSSPVRRQSLADSGRRRLGGRSLEPSASAPEIIKPSWMQAAELTCDRAALLVSQDPKVVVSVIMKLTGGSAG